jgi:putative SOS response-associated peptidase YedK
MCNRYVSPEEAEIERFWHIGRRNQWRGQVEVFPRGQGAFVRTVGDSFAGGRDLVVGQWGLIPWFAKTPALKYATNNARFEEIATKASFKQAWAQGQRCIIPAVSFDEPCWETGRNVWWRFRRADGAPWGLAGLWNAWVNPEPGEFFQSFTVLTINADAHPLMSRMHKPDPASPPDRQDKRSVIAIELADTDRWLLGSVKDAVALARPPAIELIDAGPLTSSA